MVKREEVERLRERSREALEVARGALKAGKHSIAVFLADISLQLYLKAVLLGKAGSYPGTHSLRELLGYLAAHVGRSELKEFVRVNRVRLSALEDAYITSRYGSKVFYAEDAEDAVKLVEEVIEVVEACLK
ncbi:MAG: HEPN domain-containing protein [Candidatus Jordarchaeales archaeon]|nr:HEPN domain-containing protein [Candidatus Jordarchaeia archaeon]